MTVVFLHAFPVDERMWAPQLEVFAGAGHLPSVEQPDSFNGVLSDFLAPWT